MVGTVETPKNLSACKQCATAVFVGRSPAIFYLYRCWSVAQKKKNAQQTITTRSNPRMFLTSPKTRYCLDSHAWWRYRTTPHSFPPAAAPSSSPSLSAPPPPLLLPPDSEDEAGESAAEPVPFREEEEEEEEAAELNGRPKAATCFRSCRMAPSTLMLRWRWLRTSRRWTTSATPRICFENESRGPRRNVCQTYHIVCTPSQGINTKTETHLIHVVHTHII